MPGQSQALFDKAQSLMPGGVNSPVRAFRSVEGTPFFTQKAEGAMLTTVDGRDLVDFVCTWGPAIHGHNPEPIRDAVNAALNRGTSFGTPHEAEIELAELIVKHVPSAEKVRLCNSGTEATMTAVRLARGFTGRDKIVKFSGCYHGHVDSLLIQAGSGATTLGRPDSAGIPTALAEHTLVLPFNHPAALEQVFSEQGESIAAVILEPYPANAGLILPQPGYLTRLRELTDQHQCVLIFDEVMTGFRIGLGGVQEAVGVTPDLSALGKIIGGGLPVGALAGKAEIMDYLAPLGPVYQAGTLSGNPLAVAAGIASLKMLEKSNPYHGLEESTKTLLTLPQTMASAKGLPLQMPQAGSMFSWFFTEKPVLNYEQAREVPPGYYKKIFHYALKKGVYLPPSPYETCFVSTAHQGEAMEIAAEVLTLAIQSL